MYTDQVPANDMSRGLAAQYGFHIYPTVREALTLGGKDLAVDAVVLIGEHGDYPFNEKGQHLYPRYELYKQIMDVFRVMDVFRASGRSVPVYCDKFFSYDWQKARWMYDQSHELKFPLMAGSSVPVTWRRPQLELDLGSRIDHAVILGYGGKGCLRIPRARRPRVHGRAAPRLRDRNGSGRMHRRSRGLEME